jgi:hypothetical protein
MIPEEVAEIATILRNELPDLDYDKSISIAWIIYNLNNPY